VTAQHGDYLEIELTDSALKVMVPCESAAADGLRSVAGPRRAARIVALLEAELVAMLGNRSARGRQYRGKLKGGGVVELASVVRDLALRASASPLAPREGAPYERTRRLLASELGCALGLDLERALETLMSASQQQLATPERAPRSPNSRHGRAVKSVRDRLRLAARRCATETGDGQATASPTNSGQPYERVRI
jgi:RNA polymerase-interacting CarD/CdnL/TRCF family regulator